MLSSRTRKSLVGLAVAVAGAAVLFVWPPLAVAVTFAGAYYALLGLGSFNVPATRAASSVAVLLHGAIVGAGSGAPLLGVAAAIGLIPMALITEMLVRRWGYHMSWIAPAAVPMMLGLVVAAWPFGWWGIAVVPSSVAAVSFGLDVMGQILRRRSFNRPQWGLQIGDRVPDFRLPSRDGRTEFHLAEARGRFVVLFFIRSDWCPVCHVQMRIFQKEAPRLARKNVQLVGIGTTSGQSATELTTLMGIDYLFVVDEGCRVANLFGAVQPNLPAGEEVPLPATFLIDPEGLLCHTSRPDDIGEFVDAGRILSVLDAEHARRERLVA